MKKWSKKLTIIASILVVASTHYSSDSEAKAQRTIYRGLASVNNNVRLNHAKELLGNKAYKSSVIRKTEHSKALNKFIFEYAKEALPVESKHRAYEITQTIIKEANRYSMDPLFVMAIIKRESTFNPVAKGSFGEIGLMQIRPKTAEWMCEQNKFNWDGEESLYDPSVNIKIGVAYVHYLRNKFNHGRLYLSAYNMGPRNVKEALAKNIWPKDYSSEVMNRYLEIYSALKEQLDHKTDKADKKIAALD